MSGLPKAVALVPIRTKASATTGTSPTVSSPFRHPHHHPAAARLERTRGARSAPGRTPLPLNRGSTSAACFLRPCRICCRTWSTTSTIPRSTPNRTRNALLDLLSTLQHRPHRLSRATETGSTSASFSRIGPPPRLRSLSMRTVTTCWRSSADVTVPVWPSRTDEQIIRTRTPTCTPESSGADAPSWLADRHVEHVAPATDTAHRRPIVSPRGGRRRWPHSVHPSHSGSSRWTSDTGEERWAPGFLNISCLCRSSIAPAPLGCPGRPRMGYSLQNARLLVEPIVEVVTDEAPLVDTEHGPGLLDRHEPHHRPARWRDHDSFTGRNLPRQPEKCVLASNWSKRMRPVKVRGTRRSGTTGNLTDLVATGPDTPPHSRGRTRRSARRRRRRGR